jgi:hypothetical protein
MNIDPVDDCTFWYVNEYVPTSSSVGWRLRIGAFKFDACGSPDFTLSVTPDTQDICVGTDALYDVNIGSNQSYNDPVTLSVSGEPAGTSTDFSVNPVTPAGMSVLTIGSTGSAAAGSYDLEIAGVAPTSTHTTTVQLNVYDGAPGIATLSAPANGANNVSVTPTFAWSDEGAVSYLLEVATDPAFSNIIYTATVNGVSHVIGSPLNSSSTYYWRVQSSNTCGSSSYSAVYSFTTLAAPGDCGPGTLPSTIYSDDFESGAAGWTTGGTGSTWVLSGANPASGSTAYHADNVSSITDQYLMSPAILLPSGETPLTMQFWNYQDMESSSTGCYDGGVVEVSTNGGGSWTRLESELLTDPYDGAISTSFGNPLAGQNAWCGNPQSYLNSVVDMDAFAGQTVQFRFRLATDSSVSQPGWDIDDVKVQSCIASGLAVGISPDQAMTDVPGSMVDYTVTVTNTGTVSETYNLSATGVWATSVSPMSVSLDVGEAMDFTVSVMIPTNAPNGDSDVTTVLATAASAPSVFAESHLTTTSEGTLIFLPYISKP